MKELQELRNEVLSLRNIGELTKQTESILLHKLNALEKQLTIGGVGSSLPKVCIGCGTLSTKVIDKKYHACCPDNNYIPMEDYCKKSIYPDK